MTKLEDAISTCDGLHRLMRRLNGAAADVGKGGGSTYELHALLATTSECVCNLSAQLDSIQQFGGASNHANVGSAIESVSDLAIGNISVQSKAQR